jgi:predicted ABC-type transport system involved in lysophospholipase L1 biosynthesis ATPase subunit
LHSPIEFVLADEFTGNPVEKTAEKVQEAIFSLFLKIQVTFNFLCKHTQKI